MITTLHWRGLGGVIYVRPLPEMSTLINKRIFKNNQTTHIPHDVEL